MAFITHRQNDLLWLTAPLLDECSGIAHGFSTRSGGVSVPPWDSLNLGTGRGDDATAVAENYRRFFGALGLDHRRAVLSKQVHETTVRVCTADDAGKELSVPQGYTADALITSEKNLPLVVFSADCGIILLYDPVHHAAGAVHAGWRGCASGILDKTVRAMERSFGTDPRQLLAAIGPCIGSCCFETDGDVPDAMTAALGSDAVPHISRHVTKFHVDLAGINRLWLLRAGLTPENIQVSGLCTACHPELFWSHRKMGDARGAQAASITLL